MTGNTIRACLICLAAALSFVPAVAVAAPVTYLPATGPLPQGATAPGAGPAFSGAVMVGDTLYVSGTTDIDPATGQRPATPEDSARIVLDHTKATVGRAGLTMDDLRMVQIFATDLTDYAAFNKVYRTYFKGPLPARAFIGAGSLLGGARFEVMGVATRSDPQHGPQGPPSSPSRH